MAITYQRTMNINYGEKLKDVDYRKLVAELSEKGAYLSGKYGEYADNDYGYTEYTKSQTSYVISSLVDSETVQHMTLNYRQDAQNIVDGLAHLIDGLQYDTVKTKVTRKEWAKPEGSTVVFIGDTDGKNVNLDYWGENYLKYDNGTTMAISLNNGYEGLILKFTITWSMETVQRKEQIEEAMVQLVMADMGKIQSTIEGRMKLKKFGVDTEAVEIDCHFDAKTESRSECTPDIISQVRDARKGIQ